MGIILAQEKTEVHNNAYVAIGPRVISKVDFGYQNFRHLTYSVFIYVQNTPWATWEARSIRQ